MNQQPNKMTSIEAAALFISNGQTSNLDLANTINTGVELDMDALVRSSIRRTMGFDFGIKIDRLAPYILVHSNEEPFVHTKVKLFEGDVSENGLLTNEAVMNRLFKAIDRLKMKYDKVKSLDETIIDTEED